MEFIDLLKRDMNAIKYIILLYFTLFLVSCGNNKSTSKVQKDTPTSGFIKIMADESLAPVVNAEIEVFLATYLEAHIQPIFKGEVEVVKKLVLDSIHSVILTRPLNKEEKDFFTQKSLIPKETKIAIDAIAFITHKENPDSEFTATQIQDILSGKIQKWKAINPKNPSDSIRIVFDNPNSSTARYVKEKFNQNKDLPKNCFAVNTNEEVMNYVEKHKNAIGVIGVNWISDIDDTQIQKFRKRFHVVGVISEKDNIAYQPYQSYIADGNYPYTREIYFISTEPHRGLGTGLGAFIAGHRGQKIIQKAGLVPATMPVRVVEIKK